MTDLSDASDINIEQCFGDGKRSCRRIGRNQNVLDNLRPGDRVKLLPYLDFMLSFRTEPTVTLPDQGSSLYIAATKSYSFTIERNGQFDGEAIITFGGIG